MKTNLKKIVTAVTLACALTFGASSNAKADVVDTDSLREGQAMNYTIYLRAGEYVSYGVLADSDGLDVDLVAYAPNGRCLDSDYLDDARPVVVFRAPVSGEYRIRVEMVDTYHGIPSIYQLIRL